MYVYLKKISQLTCQAPKNPQVRARNLPDKDRSTRGFALALLQKTLAPGACGPLALDRLSVWSLRYKYFKRFQIKLDVNSKPLKRDQVVLVIDET